MASASSLQAEEDDLLCDAPEEFLCPIMSILMLDPVILPSSRKVVDRCVRQLEIFTVWFFNEIIDRWYFYLAIYETFYVSLCTCNLLVIFIKLNLRS